MNNSKNEATCPCGDGNSHSLRTGGICDGMRQNKLTPIQAATLLEQIRRKSQVGNFKAPSIKLTAASVDATVDSV